MNDALRGAYTEIADGGRVFKVTVVGVRGSAPREVGATLWVSRSSVWGTIGGGQLEFLCAKTAAQRLTVEAEETELFVRRFPLGADCGQCCGGVVDVLFEEVSLATSWFEQVCRAHSDAQDCVVVTEYADGRFVRRVIAEVPDEPTEFDVAVRRAFADGAARRLGKSTARFTVIEPYVSSRFRVAVFGAGHVGSAVVDAMKSLDVDLRWIDTRQHVFPAALPERVQAILSDAPAREVQALPPSSYYLVMTHSHALDYAICRAVLERGDAEYLGLIGSRTKRRRFLRRLEGEGLAASDTLTCPIGVAGIDGKRPAEIAIAVAAELLQRHAAAQGQRVSGRITALRRNVG